jgi:hypothetical protein
MKDNSLLQLGGLAAILIGIAKAISGVVYLLLPPEQRAEVGGAQFLPSFAQNPTLLLTLFWVEALVGVLGLAVVPALSSLYRSVNEGWVRWTSNLALMGFAVAAVGYVLSVSRLPGIAAAYVAGDASTKAALLAVWKSSIDLFGLWGYGAIGVWVLVLSLLALRANAYHKPYVYLGFLLALSYLLVPVGAILKIQPLLVGVAGVGGAAALVWYVWTGVLLRHTMGAE